MLSRRILIGSVMAATLVGSLVLVSLTARRAPLQGQAGSGGCSRGEANVTVYSLQGQGNTYPQNITRGPDGNFWFTMYSSPGYFSGKIGKITPSGAMTVYPLRTATPTIHPGEITTGPDGNLWFTITTDRSNEDNFVAKMTTAGVITEYTVNNPQSSMTLRGLTSGPGGNLWIADYGRGSLRRVTTDGMITEFPIQGGSNVVDVAAGPDGNLWVTQYGVGKVSRVTPTGVITEYPLPSTTQSSPEKIVVGPDGNLWITERGLSAIAKITTQGAITEYAIGGTLFDIVAGADGNLWVAVVGVGNNPHELVRITPSGAITRYELPQSQHLLANSLAAGSDGSIWFVNEQNTNKIVKFVPGACIDGGSGGGDEEPLFCGPLCGDGSVSTGEECDDGNDRNNDGCSSRCEEEPGWICAEDPSGAPPPGTACNACSDICNFAYKEQNCTDTDGGANPMVLGSSGGEYDSCKNERTVSERICGEGTAASISLPCPMNSGGCRNGACLAPTGPQAGEFEDSDGGFNIWQQGTRRRNNPGIPPNPGSETCVDTETLNEEYWAYIESIVPGQSGQVPSGVTRPVHCPNGCSNGACLPVSAQCTQCIDTQCGAPSECSPVCGDGTVAGEEECDDGNTRNGDGCTSLCKIPPDPALCGNGQTDPNEQCGEPGLSCSSGQQCTTCSCVVAGSSSSSSSAHPAAGICGDGTRDAGEQCDDGDTKDGDGCSETCEEEGGWQCVDVSQNPCPSGTYCSVDTGTEQCLGVPDRCGGRGAIGGPVGQCGTASCPGQCLRCTTPSVQ